ncbi:hypothetical protein ACU5AX_12065 [Sphingomonas sp. XXL09]|uniref:hypothetical protein n=1 Tax=Sphingomonas sp. XXL09 TaxID=3457787 RepID=UPI00406BBE77
MMPDDARAMRRWMVLVGIRLVGTAGAVLGMILAARSHEWPIKVLGIAIVLSALAMIAIVPASLAHRWRTPKP